jgi:hypothetical protein
MAKDLRVFLEHARKDGKGSTPAAPLAYRRSLNSPGEPRVYRVKAGFVCGLCGRLHGSLEPAFDCLGRCTIELRLRSPAGRSLSGDSGHYACTACGRGYANTDDAEECFERCLAKMKPSPQFEQALRRVQIKYVQRLQQHGVRSLQKIDALAEHTKMLETLTHEQQALGRKQEKAPVKVLPKKVVAQATVPPLPSSISELSTFNSPDKNVDPVGHGVAELTPEEILSSAVPVDAPVEQNGQNINDAKTQASDFSSADELNAGLSLPEEGATPPHDFVAGTSVESENAESLTGGGFSNAQPSGDVESLLGSGFTDAEPSGDVESMLGSGFKDSATSDSAPADSTTAASALGFLANDVQGRTDARMSSGVSELLEDFGSTSEQPADVKSGQNKKPPKFSKNEEEPETNVLAADVLALLQTSEKDNSTDLSSRQERQLDNIKINVDTEFLDQIEAGDESDGGLAVYVRRADMKPYRRNNAKYCCSACGNEFFTKEQVEACFFAHPEEGSEEARALLAKAGKVSGKSVA